MESHLQRVGRTAPPPPPPQRLPQIDGYFPETTSKRERFWRGEALCGRRLAIHGQGRPDETEVSMPVSSIMPDY